MISPQRLGRFLPIENGFIKPDVSADRILTPWRSLVDFIVESLMKTNQVDSIYLRGSVPRGLAVENISDIDFVYFAECSLDDVETEIEQECKMRFPFVRDVELFRITPTEFNKVTAPQKRPYFQMLLKTQGLHLAGSDMTENIPPFKPGIEMVSHLFSLSKEFSQLPEILSDDAHKLPETRKWFCRRVVRAGLELTLLKSSNFTRDLFFCYQEFSRYYPSRRAEMDRVFMNALNGHEDPLLYADLMGFLSRESEKFLLTSV